MTTITSHTFNPMTNRYAFDFDKCHHKKGFAQIDTKQGAPWYGTSCSPQQRLIVNYCEGDITETRSETHEEFINEIRKFAAWNTKQATAPPPSTPCVTRP